MEWWALFQARRRDEHPGEAVVPAFPVTAVKAAFLNHEIPREKVSPLPRPHLACLTLTYFPQRKRGSNETIAGSSVGGSHIAQVINALEDWRRNHAHMHMGDQDAQIPLRTDVRIREIEASSKYNEPKRVDTSQVLKAAGSSAGM